MWKPISGLQNLLWVEGSRYGGEVSEHLPPDLSGGWRRCAKQWPPRQPSGAPNNSTTASAASPCPVA